MLCQPGPQHICQAGHPLPLPIICRCVMQSDDMPTLCQLEHVLQAVDDLEAALRGDLAHVTSVEEAVLVCRQVSRICRHRYQLHLPSHVDNQRLCGRSRPCLQAVSGTCRHVWWLHLPFHANDQRLCGRIRPCLQAVPQQ